MQANGLFEYRDKIIDAFKNGTFLSEHLKKSDDAAYDYVLENVDDFIQKTESMSEKINLSMFCCFFYPYLYHHPQLSHFVHFQYF